MALTDPVRAEVLSINNLGRTFKSPDGRLSYDVAIDKINIARQEFAVLCGHTGCGKTSVLHMVTMRDRPSRGDIFRFGNNNVISAWQNESAICGLRHRVGTTSQRPVHFDCLSAGGNVVLRRELAGRSHDREFLQFILEGLSCTDHTGHPDLPGLMNHPIHRVSGGQSQRLEIAREIYHEPELLVLDEPTSALDPVTGQKVIQFLSRLCREFSMTVLLVTHDLDLVLPHATQVIRMATNEHRQGVIVSTERFPSSTLSIQHHSRKGAVSL